MVWLSLVLRSRTNWHYRNARRPTLLPAAVRQQDSALSRTCDECTSKPAAGVWKMVTGLVEVGEDITAAAEREVLEETGVRAAFDAVLAFRQAHGFAFGKSDFFFVVALR